jgi:hypothetical protein
MINVMRSIRILNELDKLNPGEIFGDKKNPSVWNKFNLKNASQTRGSRYSPDMTPAQRWQNLVIGKLQNYDVKNSKYFYDRDTRARKGEYDDEIKAALQKNQIRKARELQQEKAQFMKERAQGTYSPDLLENLGKLKNKLNPFYK